MIRFGCPGCNSVLEGADELAGTKVNCGKCGQRLLIPRPEHASTKLATPVPPPPPPPALRPVAPPTKGDAAPAEEWWKPAETPRPARRPDEGEAAPRAPVGGIALALLLALACVPAALFAGSPLLGACLAAPAFALGLFTVGHCVFNGARGVTPAGIAVVVAGPAAVLLFLLWVGRFEAGRPAWQRGERWAKRVATAAASPEEQEKRPASDDRQGEEGREDKGSRAADKDGERRSRQDDRGEEKKVNRDDKSEEKKGEDKKGGKDDRPKDPPPRGGTEADRLARLLKYKDTRRETIQAVTKLGRKGQAASRGLCWCVVNTRGDEREAALEALEKVHPDLHRHVVTLIVDKELHNHIRASEAIGRMEEAGAGAVPVLLSHARKAAGDKEEDIGLFRLGYWTESLLNQDMKSLATLAPTDPEVIQFLVEMVTYPSSGNSTYSAIQQVRSVAVAALVAIGTKHPRLKKPLVPALIRGVKAELPHTGDDRRDEKTALAAIKALGQFGPDAKEAIPALKKEKLNPSQQIRKAAAEALDSIEKRDAAND